MITLGILQYQLVENSLERLPKSDTIRPAPSGGRAPSPCAVVALFHAETYRGALSGILARAPIGFSTV